MAEKRRGGKKRRDEGPEKPTKEEYAVAKFLRFNVPSKEGKLVGMTVQYFVASKAVDALLESKYGNKAKSDPLFSSRAGCVDYCDRLLQKGMFHRAGRVEKKKDKIKKKKPKEIEGDEGGKEEKGKKDKKSKKSKEAEKEKEEEKEKETSEGTKEKEVKKEDEKKDEEKKKKKKVKLEMHDQQIFKDGDEYYVWIYDPVPLKTFFIGLLLVLGAIAVCLFPLWPPEVRLGVYYLSLAAAGFVGFILSLCVIRMILFCIVWGVTFGKHHFWFLPNLTEDVGFFDSFRPLYKHDIMGEDDKTKSADSKDKDKEDTEKPKSESGSKEKTSEKDNANEEDADQDEEDKEQESATGSEGDNDNGYEIVDPEDVPDKDADQEVEGETKKTK